MGMFNAKSCEGNVTTAAIAQRHREAKKPTEVWAGADFTETRRCIATNIELPQPSY
jgi:hypothetical protein